MKISLWFVILLVFTPNHIHSLINEKGLTLQYSDLRFYNDNKSNIKVYSLLHKELLEFDPSSPIQKEFLVKTYEYIYHNIFWKLKQIHIFIGRVKKVNGNALQIRYGSFNISNIDMFQRVDITIPSLESTANIDSIRLYEITNNSLLLMITLTDSSKIILCTYDYMKGAILQEETQIIGKSMSCVEIYNRPYCVYISPNDKLRMLKYNSKKEVTIEVSVTGIVSCHMIQYDIKNTQVFICFIYSNGEQGAYYWNCFVRTVLLDNMIGYDKNLRQGTNGALTIMMFDDGNMTILLLREDGFEFVHYDNKSPYKTLPIDQFKFIDLKVHDNKTYILYMKEGNKSPLIEYIPCKNEEFNLIKNIPRTFNPISTIEIQSSPDTTLSIVNTTFTGTVQKDYSLLYKYKDDQLKCKFSVSVFDDGCKTEPNSQCISCVNDFYFLVSDPKCVYAEDPTYQSKHFIDITKREILYCGERCYQCKRAGYILTQCEKCEDERDIIYLNNCYEKCPRDTYTFKNKCTTKCPSDHVSAIQNERGICLKSESIKDSYTNEQLRLYDSFTEPDKQQTIENTLNGLQSPTRFEDLRNVQLVYLFIKDSPLNIVKPDYHSQILDYLSAQVFQSQSILNSIIIDKPSRDMLLSIMYIITNPVKNSTAEDMKRIRKLYMSLNVKKILEPIINQTDEYQIAANAFIYAFLNINDVALTDSYNENLQNFGGNQTKFSTNLHFKYNHSLIATELSHETRELNVKTTTLVNTLWDKTAFNGKDYKFFTSNFPPNIASYASASSEISFVRLNSYFDDNLETYTDTKLIQMMDDVHYDLIVLFPFEEIIRKLGPINKHFINVIIYKSKFPYLNPNVKEIFNFFFSFLLYDALGNEIPFLSLETGIKFVFERPDRVYNYCMYFSKSEMKFITNGCTGRGISKYIICECDTLQPFAISTFDPSVFNKKSEIIYDRFFHLGVILDDFDFTNAKCIYIILSLIGLYIIGLIYGIVMDIRSSYDPLVIQDEAASNCKCFCVDIVLANAERLGNEIYKEETLHNTGNNSSQQNSPKVPKRQGTSPKKNTSNLSPPGPKPKRTKEVMFELDDKETSGNNTMKIPELHLESFHEDDEDNNNKEDTTKRNTKSILHPNQKRRKKSSDTNDEERNQQNLIDIPNLDRRFCTSFTYMLFQEYTPVTLFIQDIKCNSKVMIITLFILRLLFLLSIISLLSPCYPVELYWSFTGYDILASMIGVIIVDVFYTISKSVVLKKKVNLYDSTSVNQRKANKVIVILVTVLIGISFCIYGLLNCLCINIINFKQEHYCNIIEDFFFAILFDWCLFEILMILFKSVLLYLMVNGKSESLKRMSGWIVTLLPWVIPMIGW